MIDVIIPYYNASETIKHTLSSIAYQSIIDNINVYLVDDCSDESPKEIVDFFKNTMNIKLITLSKNGGPGNARQKGIDSSTGDYIVFIDADDIFQSSTSIESLYNKIKTEDLDFVVGNFSEEKDNYYTYHPSDQIWLHGKIYKREFIKKNNIRMLSINRYEDLAYNYMFSLYNAKIGYLDEYVYIWCNCKSSITRRENDDFEIISIPDYAKATSLALDSVAINDDIKYNVSSLAFTCLYTLYLYHVNFHNNERYKKVEKNIYPYAKNLYMHLTNNEIDYGRKKEIMKSQLIFFVNSYTLEDVFEFYMSFDDYIKKYIKK